MTEAIINYGNKITHENNLREQRKFFNIGTYDISSIITHINNNYEINLSAYNQKIYEKTFEKSEKMKFHVDDCGLMKHGKNTVLRCNNIIISNKYSLYHKKALPIYTIIIYLSAIGIDFVGGEFMFSDGDTYSPNKYDVLLFNSMEVHCVKPIIDGTRRCILIKFYEQFTA